MNLVNLDFGSLPMKLLGGVILAAAVFVGGCVHGEGRGPVHQYKSGVKFGYKQGRAEGWSAGYERGYKDASGKKPDKVPDERRWPFWRKETESA